MKCRPEAETRAMLSNFFNTHPSRICLLIYLSAYTPTSYPQGAVGIVGSPTAHIDWEEIA